MFRESVLCFLVSSKATWFHQAVKTLVRLETVLYELRIQAFGLNFNIATPPEDDHCAPPPKNTPPCDGLTEVKPKESKGPCSKNTPLLRRIRSPG